MFVSVQLHILGDPLCSVGEFYNKDCNSKLPPVRSHLDVMCLSVYSCIYWATPKCSPGELYNKDCNSKIPPVRSLTHSLSLSLTPSLSHTLYHPDITVMVDWAYNTKLLTLSLPLTPSVSLPIYRSFVILMECVGQCTVAYTGQPPVFSWGILQQRL